MKQARAAAGLPQQELADRLGVSRQTINAIEKGACNPMIKLYIGICRGLGLILKGRSGVRNDSKDDIFKIF